MCGREKNKLENASIGVVSQGVIMVDVYAKADSARSAAKITVGVFD